MGNTKSGPLTHKGLFDRTENTRDIMDRLLEYMLKQISVRDFVALSNPAECKKYVLFMANRLNQHFYEIKVTPVKGAKDHIMFRSIKELVSPDARTDTEKQSLCLSIAYFYTRIFQIYGALALTLIDDISTTKQLNLPSVLANRSTKTGISTPGTAQVYMKGGSMIGGVTDTVALGLFDFLRGYLHDEYQEPYGFSTRYNESKAYVYFKRDPENRDELGQKLTITGTSTDTIYQHGKFSIGYQGMTKYTYVPIIAHNVFPADIKCQFKSIQYVKKGSSQYTTIDIPSNLLTTLTITLSPTRDPVTGVKTFQIKEAKGLTVTDFLNQLFDKLIPFIKTITETDVDPSDQTVSVKDLLSPGYKTETGISPQFSIERIIQNLQNTRPLGHCIARGLQLLKTIPLGNEPGYSSICKSHFLETHTRTKDGTTVTFSRSGIPLPNQSLIDSPGLATLSQLFYDTIASGSPRLEINKVGAGGQPSSLEQYTKFMTDMAILFGHYRKPDQSVRDPHELAEAGLKGIQNRRDASLCQGKSQEDISLTPLQARDVYSVVEELFETQLKHATNCGQIFSLLFYIKKEKDSSYYTIRLSDRIIQGGIPEIEKINQMARTILTKYYTQCETTYLRGVQKVLTYHTKEEKQKKAAMPAPSAVPSSAPSASQKAAPKIVQKAAPKAVPPIPSTAAAQKVAPTVTPAVTATTTQTPPLFGAQPKK